MVVYLSIERDPDGSVLVGHRLSPRRREIHDGKTAMGQSRPVVGGDPDAGVVGSAMHERLPHPDQNSFSDLLGRVRPVEAEGSADPTHRSTSQLRHHADRQGLAAGNIYSGPGLVQNLTEIRPAAKETAGVPEELRRVGWASGGGRWRKGFQD